MKKAFLVLISIFAAAPAFAQETASAVSTSGQWGIGLAAALAIGLGAIGGTMAQGRVGAQFLEGIARNPAAQDKMFVPMILALALIESLVVLSFLIAIFLLGKI